MKVRSSIKKIDPDDQIVKRRGRLYVINKKKPRNKQRQGWLNLYHFKSIKFLIYILLELDIFFLFSQIFIAVTGYIIKASTI